ncbi:hypothetical protein MUK42_11713 [Musa troglodytarum]|uniref:Uncharacterized protein n=1 Tax=Musa troglodytarum TaxID=320322 RepID=A0A9E7HJS8_9LILI|nr:hypothetical protein MUK42_11713 [Musa troglodytarum]
MEIPLVAEALPIPGLIARILSDLAGAWASVALVVAGFAAFLGFLGRAKLALLRYRRARSAISQPACCRSSSEDDDDDVVESESPSDDDDDEDEAPSSSSDEYDSASGSYWDDHGRDGGLDLALGGAVVRTWEGLGLGFDRSDGLISLMDLDRGEVLRSLLAQAPIAAESLASPAVVVSAADGAGAAAAVRVWDARAAGERTPAAAAEWQPILRRRVVKVAGRDGRVFVGGDDGVITAADLRRGRSPPVVETWRESLLPLLRSPK